MVTYNHADLIAQAIESVLSQEVDFEYELLIGEDCSTDNTREICLQYARQYPDRIALTLHERNVGVYANWTGLYQLARGEFIAILDGDDYWTSPFKLMKQVQAMVKNPDWSGCFHKAQVIDAKGTPLEGCVPAVPPLKEVTLRDIAADNCIASCSVMYRRGVVPVIPDWFAALAMGDWPLHMMHAMHGPLGYLDELLARYRLHPGGMWTGMNELVRLDQLLRVLFAVEANADPKYRSMIADGRHEFLSRRMNLQEDELARLRKIEARYRALQLHRLAAIGKWLIKGKSG